MRLDVSRQRADVEAVRNLIDLDVTTLRAGVDLTLRSGDRDIARLRARHDPDADRNRYLEARIVAVPIPI